VVNLYPPLAHCDFLPAAMFTLPPFHALPLEYPPLSLAIFSLALFAPLHYYTLAFAILMALIIISIYWLLLRHGPRGAALAFAIYMVIGAWGIALGRFDLAAQGEELPQNRWPSRSVGVGHDLGPQSLVQPIAGEASVK